MQTEHALLGDILHVLKEIRDLMPTIDVDVQTATTLITDLVAALEAAANPVSAADQSALEAAITAGQAALPAQPAPAAGAAPADTGTASDAPTPNAPPPSPS